MTIWTLDAIASATALILLSLLAPELTLSILAGGVFAELPDVIWIHERLILKAKSKNWFFVFHRVIQWSQTQSGLLVEVGYFVIIVTINALLLKIGG
jgi:hypothetical protein